MHMVSNGISKENEKRTKNLTSKEEIRKRAMRLEEIDQQKNQREQLDQSKIEQSESADRAIIKKLCDGAGMDVCDTNVEHCELKHFGALLAPELKLFIINHHLQFTKMSDVNHLKHPRGKRALEAATNGEEKCISVAYGLRNVKRRLLASNEVQISAPVIADAVRAEPLVIGVHLYNKKTI
jgi:hypothetical protein